MITNRTIGSFGRLGNQLFQYAFLFGQCLRQNRCAIIDADRPGFDLMHFRLRTDDMVRVLPHRMYQALYEQNIVATWPELSFLYSPELAAGADGCEYAGFFQSPFYFDDCATALRKMLRIGEPLGGEAARWEALFDRIPRPVVGVHVRRGDYLVQPRFHPNLHASDYYEKSLRILRDAMSANFSTLVFSDDIEWCESSGLFADYPNVRYVSGLSHVEDFHLMGCCDHHVVANSSFSWWGAWMAAHQDHIVIAPREWFGPAGVRQWHTIYPPGWRVVATKAHS